MQRTKDAEIIDLRDALNQIAEYDKGHLLGLCPYGCDTPNIARHALRTDDGCTCWDCATGAIRPKM